MSQYSGVQKINYLNESYDLAGSSVEEVLSLLSVDPSRTDMEVIGDTLYISAKSGTKGAYEGVAKINYLNESYDLAGSSVEEVLSLLSVDPSRTDMEVIGDTLYISAKSGTKGSDEVEVEVDPAGEVISEDAIEALLKNYSHVGRAPRHAVIFTPDGKLVYKHPRFSAKELAELSSLNKEVHADLTDEEILALKHDLALFHVAPLAEAIGIEPENALKVARFFNPNFQ